MNEQGSVQAPERVTAAIGRPITQLTVLHWYDFICPFCYIGQSRDAIFEDRGFEIADLAFEIHPEIPPGGKFVGPRSGEMYDRLQEEADDAGLPLHWPERLPNSRMALASAEWVRRNRPDAFREFARSLFAAHFADGVDIGSQDVVRERARAAGVNVDKMGRALADESAYLLVSETEMLGRQAGVRGTPAWLVGGKLIAGLLPQNTFIQIAEENLTDRKS
ncbi:putative DsbA family dithiol-disulfide isomerase [Rhizobium sp. BK313]|uniref:DsbA family oxidoreductase n=1 Tax=Rhizobium sp. BK313 TaxID=2587081 RepID=UPI00105C25E5|nr:DsbA family protein [Rhizobium sp. BK313]MBB3456503.1 putative DsbA family dithiol-disulfide isomerase [Rhizobium sp. BK313]